MCAPIWAKFMRAAVPIQRRSGETISPVPEKNVPANLTAAAQDDENRPRRRRRRRRRTEDETVATSPVPEAREPKTHETDVREPRGEGTPAPKGEASKPSNENERSSEGDKPASGGNEPKSGGESAPEAPPAAPKE